MADPHPRSDRTMTEIIEINLLKASDELSSMVREAKKTSSDPAFTKDVDYLLTATQNAVQLVNEAQRAKQQYLQLSVDLHQSIKTIAQAKDQKQDDELRAQLDHERLLSENRQAEIDHLKSQLGVSSAEVLRLTAANTNLNHEISKLYNLRTENNDLQIKRENLNQQFERVCKERDDAQARLDELPGATSASTKSSYEQVKKLTEEFAAFKVEVETEAQAKEEATDNAFVGLLSKILKVIVYNNTADWKFEDMKLLDKHFNFVKYPRNPNPPRQFLVTAPDTDFRYSAYFASGASTLYKDLKSDFGGLLCTCLSTERLHRDEDLRGHVIWLDRIVLPKVCKAEALTDAEQTILCCLEYHVGRLLTETFIDGVSFSWTACLMVRLACTYDLPWELILNNVQQSTERCSLLQAAGILRLRMLLRTLPHPTADEDSIVLEDLEDIDDPRFKPNIEHDTELCILDMASFLQAVCIQNLVGKNSGDSWYVSVQNGKQGLIALSEPFHAFYLLRIGNHNFFTDAKPEIEYDFLTKVGRAVWDVGESWAWGVEGGTHVFATEFRTGDALYEFLDVFGMKAELAEKARAGFRDWHLQERIRQARQAAAIRDLERQLAE